MAEQDVKRILVKPVKTQTVTPNEVTNKQIERYRLMTGEQRLLIALRLHELSCEVARDGIRSRYPNANLEVIEEQLRMRLRQTYRSFSTIENGDD